MSEWKAVLNAIGDIGDEAMFICNDDGITFRGMDPTHIALLDVTFPRTSFENFKTLNASAGRNNILNKSYRVLEAVKAIHRNENVGLPDLRVIRQPRCCLGKLFR